MRVTPLLFYIAGFAACSPLVPRPAPSTKGYLAPLYGIDDVDKMRDEYIVVFQPGHNIEQHFEAIGKSLTRSARFRRYGYGYGAILDDDTRDSLVRRDPGVRVVDVNRPIYFVEPVNSTAIEDEHSSSGLPHEKRMHAEVHRPSAPHGLKMLTTGSKRFYTSVKDDQTYDYLHSAGEGVQNKVYVVDSGIRISHSLFEGRARNFGDLSPEENDAAGTIGVRKYGVAPSASLISVKVLGKGSNAGMLADAIVDITAEHNANKAKTDGAFWDFRGSVICMAVSWNNNIDASNTYPCAVPVARCVVAVDNTYNKYEDSNYGSNVNYIAPGVDTLSPGNDSDTSPRENAGTSQACAHAAGAAAIF
ncbi:uncharacterized protein LTR77_000016 [Saxophila tyrrhenica]|uniref:Uncharacterized protein n=1 Tax=Saxophila tyrrhenica TaxID=1690608 RepID=A0AAV9PQ21_9PEZI|nr:hypothetical protein LTR77_000016 [Saxophila tyrrhenica]